MLISLDLSQHLPSLQDAKGKGQNDQKFLHRLREIGPIVNLMLEPVQAEGYQFFSITVEQWIILLLDAAISGTLRKQSMVKGWLVQLPKASQIIRQSSQQALQIKVARWTKVLPCENLSIPLHKSAQRPLELRETPPKVGVQTSSMTVPLILRFKILFSFCFERVQFKLKFLIILPLVSPPKCWDYRHAPSSLTHSHSPNTKTKVYQLS